MRKILFTYRDLHQNLIAFQYATYLAVHFGASIVIFEEHEINNFKGMKLKLANWLTLYQEDFELNFPEEWMQFKIRFHEKILNEIPIKVYSTKKILYPKVEKIIIEEEIDFIVLQTRTEFTLVETIFGSFEEDIFKNAKPPILAIPQNIEFKEFKNIVFPTDLNQDYINQFKLMWPTVKNLNHRISFLHVMNHEKKNYHSKQDEFRKEVSQIVGDHNFNYIELKHQNTLDGLDEYSADNGNIVYVMFKQSQIGLDSFFKVSSSAQLAFFSKNPIIKFQD